MNMKKIKPRESNWMSVVLQEDMMHVCVNTLGNMFRGGN